MSIILVFQPGNLFSEFVRNYGDTRIYELTVVRRTWEPNTRRNVDSGVHREASNSFTVYYEDH
jgi:hypothetical protein